MAVDAAQAWNIQHHLRQDQAVGDHHHQIGREGSQFGLRLGVAQRLWLVHRDVVRHCQLLDRAGHHFLPPAGRPIRLGVHRDHLMGAIEQGLEVVGSKLGGTRKNDAHGPLLKLRVLKEKGLPQQAFAKMGITPGGAVFRAFS